MAEQINLLGDAQNMAPPSTSTVWGGWSTQNPYKGASSTKNSMRAWSPSQQTADKDVITNLSTLRDRSRDLVRNVPVASASVLTMTSNVVGTGLKARPKLDHELLGITEEEARAFEKKARVGFSMWGNSKFCDAERKHTFSQLQTLALRTKLQAGDCFGLTPFIETPASPFTLSIKLLDGERCQNPNGVMDSQALAGGIEVDQYGAPVAYHFTVEPNPDQLSSIPTVRVPAFGEESGRPLVLHLFSADRPDQRRGVPFLTPVIETLKQLGRYQDAEVMSAVVSGMFTVFVKTPTGDSDYMGNVDPDDKVSQDSRDIELLNGGVVDLAEGESIDIADPKRPNPNYEPFVNAIFREAGAGLGLPFEQIMKHFSSSYTSARASFLEGWRTYKIARKDLVSDFCQPVYETWLMWAVSSGFLEAPGFF